MRKIADGNKIHNLIDAQNVQLTHYGKFGIATKIHGNSKSLGQIIKFVRRDLYCQK